MKWIPIAIVLAVIVLIFVLKNAGSIKPEAARDLIKSGAIVIDVRSPEEYRSRHLSGVVNIPSDRLESEIASHAPDKNSVLLLHCLSGARSGMATQKLKGMGYKQVYNLGSYSRAEKILASAR